MRNIKIVCDAFAICDDDCVIAVVTKCNEAQWGIYPTVACDPIAVAQFISLQYAIQEAIKLKVRP